MSKNIQETVLEVLESLVPEGDREKVSEVMTNLMDEMKNTYDAKLAEEVAKVTAERETDWQTTEKGYGQAVEVIEDLRNRLVVQKEEFDEFLKTQYAAAHAKLTEEREKNGAMDKMLRDEYEKKYQDLQEMMVEKVDEFLAEVNEIYREEIRVEVLNDPWLAEHRGAFEKVLDIAKEYISDEDVMLATNVKVEDLARKLEQTEAVKHTLESKNMRLMTENHKYKEYLKETKELVEKHILTEQNARIENAKKAEGRGEIITESERKVVIGETQDRTAPTANDRDDEEPKTLTEQWQILAGTVENTN